MGTTANVGATLRGGLEASVLVRPLEGLVLSASGTFANARVLKDDSLLPYFAPSVGRLDAGYSRSGTVAGRLVTAQAGLGVTAIGPRPQPFREFSSGFGLLDARLGVEVGPFELRLDVTNLLDARWRDGEFTYGSNFGTTQVASLLPARHFTAGAPRTATFTLEVHL